MSTLQTLASTFAVYKTARRLELLEVHCRVRLTGRPYLLGERPLLALCLSERGHETAALVEWDESIWWAERFGHWSLLASCLGLMAPYFPREALGILDGLKGAFPPSARRYWRSRLLAANRRHAEASASMPTVIRTTDRQRDRLLV
ncbi:hypothetical protein J7643_13140 [bacterium]|nr:hypothetical protein [bacterium]